MAELVKVIGMHQANPGATEVALVELVLPNAVIGAHSGVKATV